MGGSASREVVELLGRVPVFSTLKQDDLERIAQLAVPRSFGPGEVVFREGDASDTCYIVREGHARAVRAHRDGRTITLARFGPGDIFGELALFEDERRSATVEAIEPTSVVAVLGPDMRRLLGQHAEISSRLAIALGRRLRETNERLSRQSFQTVQSRVAVVLSQLVDQEQAQGAGGDVLRHGHAGRPRAAGGVLAGVGQPLSGGARARRRDLSGQGQARGPRSGRPSSSMSSKRRRAPAQEVSAGGVVVRDRKVAVIVPIKRAPRRKAACSRFPRATSAR